MADVGGDLRARAVGADEVLRPDGVLLSGQAVEDLHIDAVGVLPVAYVLRREAGLGAALDGVAYQDRFQVGLRDVDGQAR